MEKAVQKIAILGDACCGCGACASKCPSGCIELKPDRYGFRHPMIDFGSCINCGLCDSVCPALDQRSNDKIQDAIWAKSANVAERLASSSGGIFALLAHRTLTMGGLVCGAAWDEGFKAVHHVFVEDEDELDSIMRSKYVQSLIDREVYEGVLTTLRAGKNVLFAGTACQVAGMKKYLGKLADSDNFLAVDVICHGVPSPLLWRKWVEYQETCAGALLHNVNMRNKVTGWASYSVVYEYAVTRNASVFADGGVFEEDWYFKAFLNNASLRPSCFSCPAKRSCGSDITLGDFWGIQNTHPEVECWDGVSAVLCNTAKGLAGVEAVKPCIEWGPSSFEEVSQGNPSLSTSVAPYPGWTEFMRDLCDGVPVEKMMDVYTFAPTYSQRIKGRLGAIKRRAVAKLFR